MIIPMTDTLWSAWATLAQSDVMRFVVLADAGLQAQHGAGPGSELTQTEASHEIATSIAASTWAESILFAIVNFGVIVLAVGLVLLLYRILKGPQLADRVLAADALSIHVVGLVILLAIRLRTEVFFDAALIVAIIGFASTLAFAQYIGNRRRARTS